MSAIDTALTGYASAVHGYNTLATTVLLCYDCLLNLDREIPLIWSRRPTITSVFYVLCRYSMVLYAVLGCVSSSSDLTCTAVSNTRHVLGVFFSPVVTVSAYVKVYAVSRRDWRWTSIAVMLGLVSLATHIFLYAESTFKIATLPDFVESCIETRGISDVELKRLIIATRICAIASDFTVIAAITYHTRGQGILSQGLPQSRPSLVLLIQRDGFVMFVFFAVLNVFAVALYFTVPYGWALTIFVDPAISIIISRSVLRLLAATNNSVPDDSDDIDTLHLSFVQPEHLPTELSSVVHTANMLNAVVSRILSEPDDMDTTLAPTDSSCEPPEVNGDGCTAETDEVERYSS